MKSTCLKITYDSQQQLQEAFILIHRNSISSKFHKPVMDTNDWVTDWDCLYDQAANMLTLTREACILLL